MPAISRPTEDELLADSALHIIERAGWESHMQSSMGNHTCSLIRQDLRFQSRPHPTRAGAVCEVASRLAESGHYRPPKPMA